MKSYNNLWEKFISDENVELAIHDAALGKKHKESVRNCLEDPNFKEKIKIYANNFYNMAHHPKIIYDGIQRKKRTIIIPTFYEQVVHHMVVNILKPIIMHGMYEHSYGSVPGRGVHKAKKYIEKWIQTDPENTKYCLKMDITQYFASVPLDKFMDLACKKIKDKKFLNLLETIIYVTDKGFPLGFYTSQWTANWYLNGLDHYIKENLKAKYYIRYVDDMVIFGNNKEDLHKMRILISKYLTDRLGLSMKKNYQVFPIDKRSLDFLGFEFARKNTILRKSLMIKSSRKARNILKSSKFSIFEIRQMLSYFGWFDHADMYGFYLKYIKPYVSYSKMIKKISRVDRKEKSDGMV